MSEDSSNNLFPCHPGYSKAPGHEVKVYVMQDPSISDYQLKELTRSHIGVTGNGGVVRCTAYPTCSRCTSLNIWPEHFLKTCDNRRLDWSRLGAA